MKAYSVQAASFASLLFAIFSIYSLISGSVILSTLAIAMTMGTWFIANRYEFSYNMLIGELAFMQHKESIAAFQAQQGFQEEDEEDFPEGKTPKNQRRIGFRQHEPVYAPDIPDFLENEELDEE